MPDLSRYQRIATSDFRSLANVGTAETDLNTLWLPPGFIGRELGDGVEVSALLVQAANVNIKTSKLYWGAGISSTVAGVVNGNPQSNGSFVLMRARIYSVAPNVQSSESQTLIGPTGISILQFRDAIYTQDTNEPIQLRISGESDTASDDLIGKILKATYVPAGAYFPVG